MAVLAALGGALLTVTAQVAYDRYKEWHTPPSAQRAFDLYQEFNALGDTPRAASEFIMGREEGSASDVRTVARHFHKLVVEFVSNRITEADARTSYRTTLDDWSRWFDYLGRGDSPGSPKFNEMERKNFVLLSAALTQVGGPVPVSSERTDPANALMTTSNVQ